MTHSTRDVTDNLTIYHVNDTSQIIFAKFGELFPARLSLKSEATNHPSEMFLRETA